MARSEIDSAITLLTERDYVSAHVLAFAANDILRGVARAQKIRLFNESFEDRIKPEHLREWRKKINEDYTVFKHADKDPDRVLKDFRPETTVIAIFFAVTNYNFIYKQVSISMAVYRAWFFCRHPTWFREPFRSFVGDRSVDFGNPLNRPLGEALVGLKNVLTIARKDTKLALAQLSPEVANVIEV